MSTRKALGILAGLVVAAIAAPAQAQTAISVVGGGLGQGCYEAVKYENVTASQALKVCDLALEQEQMSRRDRAATYTNRGIIHMRLSNNEMALSDYTRSLTLLPALIEAKVNQGAALYNLKRYQEALVALNEGIASESIEARAVGYYNRGLAHEKLGNLQSAYEDFRQALRLKPDFELADKQMQRFTVVPAGS